MTRSSTHDGIDTARWPDIAAVPNHPLRAAVARRLVRHALRGLPLQVSTADGDYFGAGTWSDPQLRLVHPEAFYQRLGAGGLIGFGEAYMAGDWRSDDVVGLLTVLAGRLSTLIPSSLQRFRSMALRRRPAEQDNTIDGARRNIHQHYDLSNDLFALFLDDTMTYSSALFDDPSIASRESLESAQHRKITRLLDLAGVRAGSHVLDIGTGWGELAIQAAARGARVTSVTISTEQARLARRRIAEAGHSDRVDVLLRDYRDLTGRYDAVVSVEMIEAVGANHWSEYFGAVERLLATDGRVALQAITMPHDRMVAGLNSYTWILKYIFPGGQIPSVRAIAEHTAGAGLAITSQHGFGTHYAETLRRWRERFEQQADAVDGLGFDEIFRAMWSLYLAYSEAGFRSGYLDVVQFALVKRSRS